MKIKTNIKIINLKPEWSPLNQNVSMQKDKELHRESSYLVTQCKNYQIVKKENERCRGKKHAREENRGDES